ncbi:hypothetical protein [Streptosporangium sp. NPDC004631]
MERLAAAETIAAWAAVAWELLADGASRQSIARSTGMKGATVDQRVSRYRPAL